MLISWIDRFCIRISLSKWERQQRIFFKKLSQWEAKPLTRHRLLHWLNQNDGISLIPFLWRNCNFPFKQQEFIDNQIGSFSQRLPSSFLPQFYLTLSVYPNLGSKNWFQIKSFIEEYRCLAYAAKELEPYLKAYKIKSLPLTDLLKIYPKDLDCFFHQDAKKLTQLGQTVREYAQSFSQQQALIKDMSPQEFRPFHGHRL